MIYHLTRFSTEGGIPIELMVLYADVGGKKFGFKSPRRGFLSAKMHVAIASDHYETTFFLEHEQSVSRSPLSTNGNVLVYDKDASEIHADVSR